MRVCDVVASEETIFRKAEHEMRMKNPRLENLANQNDNIIIILGGVNTLLKVP